MSCPVGHGSPADQGHVLRQASRIINGGKAAWSTFHPTRTLDRASAFDPLRTFAQTSDRLRLLTTFAKMRCPTRAETGAMTLLIAVTLLLDQSFAPTPKVDPAIWFQEEQGAHGGWPHRWTGRAVTHFRISVGPNGRVASCTIEASSGHASLDQAACSALYRRALFDPARNDAGEPVSGVWRGYVRWREDG